MKRFLTLTSLFITCFCQQSMADIVVIVNKDCLIKELTKKQVIDIYMGRTAHFPNGDKAMPIDQQQDSVTRKLFYHHLVDKTVSEINAYWARLLFSGRATPPRSSENSQALINIVKNNKAAIGYVELNDLTDDVKVLIHVD